MIQVPARVKDALKSGDYKKNVNINMYQVVPEHEEQLDDISIERSYSTIFKGTYDFDGFEVGDVFKFKYPAENAFSSVTIYIAGQAPMPIPAIVSESETCVTLTYSSNYNSAEFSFDNVSIVPAGTDTANLEVWRHVDEKTIKSTIDNSKLVSESVKFDERMCSDTELKFGLCEGTSVEFQYFDFPNIRGKQIEIFIDVEYKDEHGELMWYPIPMGWFEVAQCPRQASTGIYKATAYNKLQSNYLDVNQNVAITEIIKNSPGQVASVNRILAQLLDDYSIIYDETIPVNIVPLKYRDYEDWNGVFNGYELRILNADGSEYFPSAEPYFSEPRGKYFTFFMAQFMLVPQGENGSFSSFPYGFVFFLSKLWETILYPVFRKYLITGNYADHFHPYPDYTIGIYSGVMLQGNYIPEEYAQQPDSSIRVAGSLYWDNSSSFITRLGTYKDVPTYDTGSYTGYFPILEIPIMISSDLMTKPEYYIDAEAYFDDQTYLVQSKLIERYAEILELLRATIAEAYNSDSIARTYLTLNDIGTNNITLRDLQGAVFEADIQYGKLDRVTDVFSGIELNNGSLYPRDNLYPADTLFPSGEAEAGYPAMYSKLWADEGNVRSFRNLIITYRTTVNNSQEDTTLTRVVNADGTDDYYMDNNWLFRNLSWTAQQVGVFADMMVAKLQKIKWFPFEMWCAGLPYLESGDAIEIKMKNGTYPSYVLRRTLNGIQNLQDEMINGTLDVF